MPRLDRTTVAILIALVGATFFLWRNVFSAHIAPGFYALDVGQGDATLIVLESGAKILTDAGPDRNVLASLEHVLGPVDRTIDLAVITHPQLDHFNGFNTILDHYRVGAFITNGRTADANGATVEWNILMEKVAAKHVPLVVVGRGDHIRQDENSIDILSPDRMFVQSGESNDTAIIELVRSGGIRMLLTGDAGFSVEDFLVNTSADIRADILKVGHHGSKYSTGAPFLTAVGPAVATISDGVGNTYGHPTPETLARLKAGDIETFRTDEHGTIRITAQNGALQVTTER